MHLTTLNITAPFGGAPTEAAAAETLPDARIPMALDSIHITPTVTRPVHAKAAK